MSYGGAYHWIPHLSTKQGFKSLPQPSKMRMSIGYSKNRTMDRNKSTLWKRDYLNRKISKPMQLPNLIIFANTFTQGILHNTGIFINDIFF